MNSTFQFWMRFNGLGGDNDVGAIGSGFERDGKTDPARSSVIKRVLPFNGIGETSRYSARAALASVMLPAPSVTLRSKLPAWIAIFSAK